MISGAAARQRSMIEAMLSSSFSAGMTISSFLPRMSLANSPVAPGDGNSTSTISRTIDGSGKPTLSVLGRPRDDYTNEIGAPTAS